MFRLIQYGLAVLIALFFFFNNFSEEISNVLCLTLILLFGIPHGAVDHKIHLSTSSNSRLYAYIIKYLLIAGGYVLWWFIDPPKALFIFILLSSYHFGQELFQDNGVNENSAFSSLIWGFALVVVPMLISFSEVKSYLEVITSTSLVIEREWILTLVAGVLLSIAVINLVWHVRKKTMSVSNATHLGLFLSFIIMLHLLLPFVQAFTLYFVFFHSFNAFKHQFMWLKKAYKNYNFKSFGIDLFGFSAIAIIGIILLLWMLAPENSSQIITYFFILTSLITLPHAITLDQFYKFKNQFISRPNS